MGWGRMVLVIRFKGGISIVLLDWGKDLFERRILYRSWGKVDLDLIFNF